MTLYSGDVKAHGATVVNSSLTIRSRRMAQYSDKEWAIFVAMLFALLHVPRTKDRMTSEKLGQDESGKRSAP